MSYSLNDKFSIDTKTSSARLDGNLELKNYITYKTNDNTINLTSTIVPNKYDYQRLFINTYLSSNDSFNNYQSFVYFGEPFIEYAQQGLTSNVTILYNYINKTFEGIYFPLIDGNQIFVPGLSSVEPRFTFRTDTSDKSISLVESKYYSLKNSSNASMNIVNKVHQYNSNNIFTIYDILLVYFDKYPTTSRVSYEYKNTNYGISNIYRLSTYDGNDIVSSITDISCIDLHNTVISGYYNSYILVDLSYSSNLDNPSDYIKLASILPATEDQFNYFIISIDTLQHKVNWSKTIVGLKNQQINLLDSKLCSSPDYIVNGIYISTKNEPVTMYNWNSNTNIFDKETTIQGTNINDTREFLLTQYNIHGKILKTSRIIPTTTDFNYIQATTDIYRKSGIIDLQLTHNNDIWLYIKNDAKNNSYRIINPDSSYRIIGNTQNTLIYYDKLLRYNWGVSVSSENNYIDRGILLTDNKTKLLLYAFNNLTSNIDIYNSDNSLYSTVFKDLNSYATSYIVYTNTGMVYNNSYIKYKYSACNITRSFNNYFSIGSINERDFINIGYNESSTRISYTDSFENQINGILFPNSLIGFRYDYNITDPYKIFRVGDLVDKTIIDTGELIVHGDLTLTGKITSDLFMNSDNRYVRNNLQVRSKRLVYQIQENARSNFSFLYEGLYKLDPNDVELFINGYKLCYQDEIKQDYFVRYDIFQTSNTLFTVELYDYAKYGDILDITFWPSYLESETSYQPGYVLQDIKLDFWKQNQQTIYYNEKVGIGTETALTQLDVIGDMSVTGNFYRRNGATTVLYRESPFYENTNVLPINYYLPSTHYVGIGTTIANERLHINGSIYTDEDIKIGGNFLQLIKGDAIVLQGNIGIGTDLPRQKLDIAGNTICIGNIGIGTTSPLDSLHVNGRIKTPFFQQITIATNLANSVTNSWTVSNTNSLQGTVMIYFVVTGMTTSAAKITATISYSTNGVSFTNIATRDKYFSSINIHDQIVGNIVTTFSTATTITTWKVTLSGTGVTTDPNDYLNMSLVQFPFS